jgi:hypothetical protein
MGSCTHQHDCEEHACAADWSLFKNIEMSGVLIFTCCHLILLIPQHLFLDVDTQTLIYREEFLRALQTFRRNLDMTDKGPPSCLQLWVQPSNARMMKTTLEIYAKFLLSMFCFFPLCYLPPFFFGFLVSCLFLFLNLSFFCCSSFFLRAFGLLFLS